MGAEHGVTGAIVASLPLTSQPAWNSWTTLGLGQLNTLGSLHAVEQRAAGGGGDVPRRFMFSTKMRPSFPPSRTRCVPGTCSSPEEPRSPSVASRHAWLHGVNE